jgi:hypothetical protein
MPSKGDQETRRILDLQEPRRSSRLPDAVPDPPAVVDDPLFARLPQKEIKEIRSILDLQEAMREAVTS